MNWSSFEDFLKYLAASRQPTTIPCAAANLSPYKIRQKHRPPTVTKRTHFMHYNQPCHPRSSTQLSPYERPEPFSDQPSPYAKSSADHTAMTQPSPYARTIRRGRRRAQRPAPTVPVRTDNPLRKD